MPKILNPNTENARFDLSTMIEEWKDFLEAQCGYEKADPALVAALTARHHSLLRTLLHEELGFGWEEFEGLIIIPDHLAQMLEHQQAVFNISVLDQVWRDCFETVNEELDQIEEQLHLEREHGLM